jgi:cob(I)alamin adenosyltransferase
MGHRLSKIYTRTGDAGTTGLGDGSRIAKDSARITAMGDVDELNSLLGVILCEDLPADVRELFTGIQHDLFDLGGELCIPGSALLKATQPARLEAAIDKYNADLGPLKEFILPGGNRAAALTHLARTVCRRAERMTVALAAAEPVSDAGRQYLNRLSDLLFVLGRWLNKAAGGSDVLWQKGKNA